MTLPAIAKILMIFAAVLLLSRLRVHLGLALILGGVALSLSAERTVRQAVQDLGSAVGSAEFWLLMAIIVLIVEYGRFMTKKENAREIVQQVARLGGRRGRALALMATPAILGLVPMPGGALFSAPLVKQLLDGTDTEGHPPEWRTAVNYWFRHIWEYWWPLYLGVVIAFVTFKIEIWRFMAVQFPFTPVAVAAGYFFLIRPHAAALANAPAPTEQKSMRALAIVSPVIAVLVCVLLMPPMLKYFFPDLPLLQDTKILNEIALLLGLILGCFLIIADEIRDGRIHFMRAIFKANGLKTFLIVAGVLIFKTMLASSGLVTKACAEMHQWQVPAVCAVAALPFIAGIVTGLAVGFVGASFPLVVGIMNSPDSGLTPLSTIVLAYGFGYIGMMLSPVHICLLLTREYFSASLWRVLRCILPCGLVIIVFSILFHLLLAFLNL